MRLSPMVVAILTFSATLGLSAKVCGQTAQTSPLIEPAEGSEAIAPEGMAKTVSSSPVKPPIILEGKDTAVLQPQVSTAPNIVVDTTTVSAESSPAAKSTGNTQIAVSEAIAPEGMARTVNFSPLKSPIILKGKDTAVLQTQVGTAPNIVADNTVPAKRAANEQVDTIVDTITIPAQVSRDEIKSPPTKLEANGEQKLTVELAKTEPNNQSLNAQSNIIFGKAKDVELTPIVQNPTTPPETTPQQNPTTPPSQTPPQTPTSEPEVRVLVAEVMVRGADEKLQNEVYRAIRIRPGTPATRSQLQEDVKAIYDTGYFSEVNVVPEDTPLGVRVTFVVEPNPELKNVVVKVVPTDEGSRVITTEVINQIFGSQYGQILNFRSFQEGIKKLNQFYKEKGYDLAQVVEVPPPSNDGIVTLVVAEGQIEDVQVRFINKDKETTDAQGNQIRGRTRPFIITRELKLRSGDVFNKQTAQNDLRRIYGLGLFEDVQLSFSPGQDPRRVVVVVNVIERNSGSIAAGAGVSSASGLFGTISYQEQNLGGNNQKLGTELQVGQREFLFDVNFTDPWIAGDPFRTSYTVNAFQRRTISLIFDGGTRQVNLPNGDRPRVLRIGTGVTFTRPLNRNPLEPSEWVASLGLDYQQVSLRDSNGRISPKDQLGNDLSFSRTGKDDLFTLQLGAVRDRRNDPLRPTSGNLLRLGVEQTIPVGSGNILLNRLRGSYSYYIPVSYARFSPGPQTLAFNIQGGTVLGDLPPYEAFSLGGSNSVRGYQEGDLAAARSFIQATAEYRFPIFPIIGGALFVDVGTDLGTGKSVLGDPGGVRGKPGNGIGYGLGVRIQSPLGPIRIDYGFSNRGDSRLHFGIGERF